MFDFGRSKLAFVRASKAGSPALTSAQELFEKAAERRIALVSRPFFRQFFSQDPVIKTISKVIASAREAHDPVMAWRWSIRMVQEKVSIRAPSISSAEEARRLALELGEPGFQLISALVALQAAGAPERFEVAPDVEGSRTLSLSYPASRAIYLNEIKRVLKTHEESLILDDSFVSMTLQLKVYDDLHPHLNGSTKLYESKIRKLIEAQ